MMLSSIDFFRAIIPLLRKVERRRRELVIGTICAFLRPIEKERKITLTERTDEVLECTKNTAQRWRESPNTNSKGEKKKKKKKKKERKLFLSLFSLYRNLVAILGWLTCRLSFADPSLLGLYKEAGVFFRSNSNISRIVASICSTK